ncbi:CheR family methyltransferase [Baaleninema sp.]|uniref:CheR family methyltransferase n=1 Tax=Baaleninema sp. TaxID=3101197 RepID=UPI003D0103E4
MFDSDRVRQFVRLISRQTGLYVRPQDERGLLEKLRVRMKALGISSLESYYQLLDAARPDAITPPSDRLCSDREWRELVKLLVVTESYFFRDRGQFDLLRSRILPELIVKNRNLAAKKAQGAKPSLKIWSAACASGEEPYSLAILLRELLHDLYEWNLKIVGTDINEAVLERARRGEYNPWSFRQVEPRIKQQYFQVRGDKYHIDPRVRQMVQFHRLNLVRHDLPDADLSLDAVDLILCRNVFIYFDRNAVDRVLQKFYRTLSPGGYLIAAHAELQGQSTRPFHTQLFPQSVVYQRCDRVEGDSIARADRANILDRSASPSRNRQVTPKPIVPLPPRRESVSPPPPPRSLRPRRDRESAKKLFRDRPSHPSPDEIAPAWTRAMACYQQQDYADAIRHAEAVLSDEPRHLDAYTLIARAYANLGDYQKATYYCMQALEIDSLAVAPYYLLAYLCELQGKPERAKSFLKKIVYIDPHAALAYLELAQLYQSEGDRHRARKMQSTAVEILQTLPPQTVVDAERHLTAGELLKQVRGLSR